LTSGTVEAGNDEVDATAEGRGEGIARGDFEATTSHIAASFSHIVQGTLSLSPTGVVEGLMSLLIATPVALWNHQPMFMAVYGLFALVVLAIGGGAICRMAACQASTGERLSVREAIDFALERWGRLAWSLLLPVLIAAAIGAVIVILGALMALPVLDVIGGLAYGLALALGFFVAFLMIGYVLGFPLLIPAVASENCDGADAMQRAYAYAVSRPLQLIGYWIVALVGATLGFLLVSIVCVVMLNATAKLFGVLTDHPALATAGGFDVFDLTHSGAEPVITAPGTAGTTWNQRWAGSAISFWQALVLSMVAAYVLAYFFSASTIMYLLMRRAVDGQDTEEIWRPGLVPGTLAPIPLSERPAISNSDSESTSAGQAMAEAQAD
jgi:hypothetical protein